MEEFPGHYIAGYNEITTIDNCHGNQGQVRPVIFLLVHTGGKGTARIDLGPKSNKKGRPLGGGLSTKPSIGQILHSIVPVPHRLQEFGIEIPLDDKHHGCFAR